MNPHSPLWGMHSYYPHILQVRKTEAAISWGNTVGIGIRAQEKSGVPGPPSHAMIARLPHWEMHVVPQFGTVSWTWSVLTLLCINNIFSFQVHIIFLCRDLEKFWFLSLSISSRSCCHPVRRLKYRHWDWGSGRELLLPIALPNIFSFSAFTVFLKWHPRGTFTHGSQSALWTKDSVAIPHHSMALCRLSDPLQLGLGCRSDDSRPSAHIHESSVSFTHILLSNCGFLPREAPGYPSSQLTCGGQEQTSWS